MKIKLDKNQIIEQLKKEVGLPDVPYEKLFAFKVCLSPTGRDLKDSDYKNAKDYVDEQLATYESAYASFDEDDEYLNEFVKDIPEELDIVKTPIVTNGIGAVIDVNNPQILKNEMPETKIDNYFYYDVAVNGNNLTIVVYKQKESDFLFQSNFVKNHWVFIKERARDMLTGTELIISFYQFANLVGSLKNPKDDYSKYENISARMDTVFDGIKLPGF